MLKSKNNNRSMKYTIAVILLIFSAVTILISTIVLILLYFIGINQNSKINTILWLIMTFGTCFAISSGISTFFVKRYWSPVVDLVRGMKRVARGDFNVKVSLKGDKKGEIYQLVNNFNLMTDELGSNQIMRDDFINNFSHEMKTPLISIQGFTKLLKTNPNISHEEKIEYYDIIENECMKASKMSGNILLLSQFNNQKVVANKTTYFLDEQIRNCIIGLETQWKKKNIEFNLHLDCINFYSDEEMISHIWTNILENAIKFSNQNGVITVFCYKNGITSTVVEIIDTGIGMDEKTKEYMFDRFYQGDVSHSSEGCGLGMSIAKRIVQLCMGKIEVESEIGRGTKFTVTLPNQIS